MLIGGLDRLFPMTEAASIRWLEDRGFEYEEGKGLSHPLLTGTVYVGHPPWNCLDFVATVEIEVNGERKEYATRTSRNVLECLEEAVAWAYEVSFPKEERCRRKK